MMYLQSKNNIRYNKDEVIAYYSKLTLPGVGSIFCCTTSALVIWL